MFNAIRGKVVEIKDDEIIILTHSGIEFSITISLNSANSFRILSKEDRENCRVYTILQTREDGVSLFGFYDEKERITFQELLKVQGIGARGAIKILGGIKVDELITALDTQDLKTLKKVPGLGVKSAQKLMLQLRDVLIFNEESEDGGEKSGSVSLRFPDLITSFTEQGYDRKTVIKTIEVLLSEKSSELSSFSDREIENKIFPLILRRL